MLVDGATEHDIEKQEGGFLDATLAPMVASLIASMASLLIRIVASSMSKCHKFQWQTK